MHKKLIGNLALPSNHLSKARDIRSLKFIVKDVEAKLGPFEVSVEQKKNADTTKDENDNNTNIDNERSTHASDMVIPPSSNKVEVNDVSTMQIPENDGKSEEIEHSNIETKGNEEMIQTSSDKSEENVNIQTKGYEEMMQTSNRKSGEIEHGNIETKGNEEMIQTSNDKSEENINIETNGNEEMMQTSNGKSGEIEHGNIETKDNEEMKETSNGKSEEIEHSNIETKSNEEMIQTPNITKLPSEAETEVGLVREDITKNYNDVVASELKFEGSEENTHKSIEKSTKEISDTNEDRVNNNSITNKFIDDGNFEDSDNVQNIHNSTMEIAGNVENNVKNKDTTEDDNLK
ncbi:S-antigen protein-like [Trifolium pratense]|uniref:S-antigen protein-like n=1 Tax=Trifolium pratense TaxID=57577 RepID=UPI001E69402F|nr:S-antigen protein-like [Trifolium pratense]